MKFQRGLLGPQTAISSSPLALYLTPIPAARRAARPRPLSRSPSQVRTQKDTTGKTDQRVLCLQRADLPSLSLGVRRTLAGDVVVALCPSVLKDAAAAAPACEGGLEEAEELLLLHHLATRGEQTSAPISTMPSFPSRNPRVMRNQVRRPAPAAAVPPAGSGDEERMTTFQDALQFMLSVRNTLDRAKYMEFLDSINQKQRIGVRGVADRMRELLRGYPALLRHLNMFLPPDHLLSLMDDNQQEEEEPAADSLQERPASRG